jgi:hypothetical protein
VNHNQQSKQGSVVMHDQSIIRAIWAGIAIAACCIIAGFSVAAYAADKGGPAHQDIVAPKAEPWTGPYIGASAGWNVAMGSLSGDPVGVAAEGGSVSVLGGYDKQFGIVVAGVGLGASMYFGDLDTIGANHDYYGFGRLGLLINSATLIYGHLGYGRIDTDGKAINSWRLGPGVELRFPNSPISLDLRYEYGVLDVDDLIGPNVDARTHALKAGINWRF